MGLERFGGKLVILLDARRNLVYSLFKLLHSNPVRAIVPNCVFAALPPLSHLQVPCRIGGAFDGAGGWHTWRANTAGRGETRTANLRGPGAARPGDPE